MQEPITLTLDLKYLNTFAKVFTLSGQVKLFLLKTHPLMVECKIGQPGPPRGERSHQVGAAPGEGAPLPRCPGGEPRPVRYGPHRVLRSVFEAPGRGHRTRHVRLAPLPRRGRCGRHGRIGPGWCHHVRLPLLRRRQRPSQPTTNVKDQ